MAEEKQVTVETFRQKKLAGEKIVMITAYDYAGAQQAEAAGVDCILVGDSLGMVMLGYDSTLSVTMADMLHHVKAAARGAKRALLVADMPFMSYQINPEEALRNAGRFLQEAGAAAVKVEGGADVTPAVKCMVAAGIPVMGHLGLTPQSVNVFGGYRLQAKEAGAAMRLLEEAEALAAAGVFAIVLEKVPREVAAAVTQRISVPTIGIGSGPDCDGQVIVYHDLLGFATGHKYKFVKEYAEVGRVITEAVGAYACDVRAGAFPAEEHVWHMSEAEADAFRAALAKRGGK